MQIGDYIFLICDINNLKQLKAMTREEEDFILNRINGAFAKGPSNFHELTPEYWKKMEERRKAYQAQKRKEQEEK